MKLKMTKKKLLAAIVSTALLCGVGVGGTVAWLHDSAQVTNTFDLADVSGEISEEFEDKDDKKDIAFQNTGNIPAYVRVAVSASWTVDAEGTQLANVSAKDTYNETHSTSNKWVKHDGYWYYTEPVEAGEFTDILFTSVKPKTSDELGEKYEGLHFRYDVSAQLIQAEPEDAVKNAWGVTIDENGVHPVTQNP